MLISAQEYETLMAPKVNTINDFG